jgi:hypothetical protein
VGASDGGIRECRAPSAPRPRRALAGSASPEAGYLVLKDPIIVDSPFRTGYNRSSRPMPRLVLPPHRSFTREAIELCLETA